MTWWSPAAAQQGEPPGPAEPRPAASEPAAEVPAGSVEESKLPFYLRQKDGKPVLMPGWTFEEFEQLYQETQGLTQPDQPPRWVIESISASGTVRATYAELAIELAIVLGDQQPVRVPLRLDQAVLRAPIEYDGPGEPLVHFGEQGEGYVALLRGKPRQPQRLKLTALVPLAQAGGETRLAVVWPRATHSSLSIEVPLQEAEAEVSGGAVLVGATPTDHRTTRLDVQGIGGSFELAWREPTGRTAQTRPVLEAVGDLSARIDGRTVQTEATLTVRGYGAPFDRFRVRVPKDAELLPGVHPEYTVVPVPPRNGAANGVRVVEVRLAQKTSEQAVLLETRQSLDAVRPTAWFPLGGFDVIEAARQSGQIAVSVVGDWYVFWGPRRGVEQIQRAPPAAWNDHLVATFQYHSQPFTLSVRVAPRKTRLSVEPQYVLSVDPHRVGLQATLKYTARGAKVASLDVQLPGWVVDDAAPYDELVAPGGVAVDPSGLVSVALTEPMTGTLEITLFAHQDIPPDASTLRLALPQPQAESVGSAAVAVVPADNVELIPDADQTTGLVRQQVAPPMTLPARDQPPLFYREETAGSVFAADFRVHGRSIGVDVTSEVSLLAEGPRVRQKLAYTIRYEPVQELELLLPPRLAAPGSLEVLLDGQPRSLDDMPEPPDTPDAAGLVAKRLVLPEPRIGTLDVGLQYPIDVEKLKPQMSVLSTVPLAMPGQGQLRGNTVVVTAPPGVRVRRQPGPWSAAPPDSIDSGPGEPLRLSAAGRTSDVVLGVSLEDRDALGSTVVERAWIQTAITPSERRDRAVFRFVGKPKRVEVILPEGVEPGRLSVLLDGQTAEAETTPQRSLVVPLADDSGDGPHWLEVEYQIRRARRGAGRLAIELPRLGPDVWVRRLYWQLVLPANEHVIAGPTGFTPEYRWGWNGTFWGRLPTLQQRELESWSGAQPGNPWPTNAASCYLFGSLEGVDRCELRTANRSLIVLVASGLLLVVGLVLIYVPPARHPASLLAGALLMLAAALLYPAPTLLLLQAASLGLALILLAGLLHRSVSRRRRGLLLAETSSSIVDRGSTQTVRPAPAVGNKQSTQIAPAAVPTSSPDSDP